jgi:hypothetical protein
MRRLVAVIGVGAALAGPVAYGVAQTGVSGEVESVVELSLEQPAADRVDATVTATIDRTQLSVSSPGHPPTTLRAFRDPTVRTKVTVRRSAHAAGAREQTITFGPQGP